MTPEQEAFYNDNPTAAIYDLMAIESHVAALQAKYNKLAELADGMGSAYGCSGKPFRDYWDWIEEQGE